jgi:hypothetical protein
LGRDNDFDLGSDEDFGFDLGSDEDNNIDPGSDEDSDLDLGSDDDNDVETGSYEYNTDSDLENDLTLARMKTMIRYKMKMTLAGYVSPVYDDSMTTHQTPGIFTWTMKDNSCMDQQHLLRRLWLC